MKADIKSLLPDELSDEFTEMGLPSYRAKQVFSWLAAGAGSFDEMTNLPKNLRSSLNERYMITRPQLLRKQVSGQDGTVKYLWELSDGDAIETVVMSYRHGNTVCISTQVGCRMGCAFCASAIGGLVRNLTPSEMLDEVLFSQIDSGLKISNIVLMGIGEPLDNFDNVIKFLKLVNHPDGMNIGMRHISLSTSGLTEKFDKLASLDLQLTLSISLHATDDETRSRLMPVNRGRGVDALIKACEEYFRRTGRRVSFEYAMIDGVNDSEKQARLLAQQAKIAHAHVNLIPLNRVEERQFQPSKPENLRGFIKILEDAGVNVTVRRSLGGDVEASCGQLRRKVTFQSQTEAQHSGFGLK